MAYKIAVLSGDGIGPEVMAEAIKVLEKISSKYKIKLITLDDYLYNRKPTFIKFDIEGSETEAILGMKKIMRDFKPKLAICVYHKPSDLWKIPLLIKKINPRYKIFIRHYTQTQHDTVCYAI